MDQPRAGLQTTIWNNNLKSMILLAGYPVILGLVVFLSSVAIGYFTQSPADPYGYGAAPSGAGAIDFAWNVIGAYWPMIVTVVAIWFMVAYAFQGRMIRAMAKSHPVTRKEEPELYNLLENLCISQGMKMPHLEIIETHARNAFASGINDATYRVTVTRGLMQSLKKDELEAVIAHELAHIQNRDVRLLVVSLIFTGMLGLAAQLLWTHMRFAVFMPRGGNRNNGGGALILMLVIGVILWIGYAASLLARFAISRRREYMADAGAVQMTKNPDAMMRALLRISGMADIPGTPSDIKTMCFENSHAFLGMFATHPPIKARVQMIADYSGLAVPDLREKERASREEAFARPQEPGQRDNWVTRQRFEGRRNKNPWANLNR